MGTLTIRENFMFSANLRLPPDVSKEEKNERVDDIITELGLTDVADSKVGCLRFIKHTKYQYDSSRGY